MGAVLVSILGYSLSLVLYALGFVFLAGALSGQFREIGHSGTAVWLSLTLFTVGFFACAATAKLTGAI